MRIRTFPHQLQYARRRAQQFLTSTGRLGAQAAISDLPRGIPRAQFALPDFPESGEPTWARRDAGPVQPGGMPGRECFSRTEPLEVYLATGEYVSSSTLRRFARAGEGARSPAAVDHDGRYLVLSQALHAYLLEPHRFEQDFFVLEESGAAQLEQEDLLERTWLTGRQFATLKAVREAVERYPKAPVASWIDNGIKELSIYWTDASGGRWKARPDCFTDEVIVELKTTTDVRPKAFARARSRFGYDLQAAQYVEAVSRLSGRTPRVVFLAVEIWERVAVWVHELSRAELEEARRQLERVRADYRRYIEAARQIRAARSGG